MTNWAPPPRIGTVDALSQLREQTGISWTCDFSTLTLEHDGNTWTIHTWTDKEGDQPTIVVEYREGQESS